MIKNTFESLPNELFLIIFSYLSSFDLCQAFLDINNARIQSLLTSIRHSLDVSLMHYDQLHLWLNSNHDNRNRFTTLIDTVVLNNSYPCRTLLEYWKKTFKESEQINILFPSIKRFIVLQAEHFPHDYIRTTLVPLVSANNTLQYLHLIFKIPRCSYPKVLAELIRYRISVHTMILEVEQDHNCWSEQRECLHKMEQLSWPSTIQLTLSIQYPSELALLFQNNALPAIEYLNITIENPQTVASCKVSNTQRSKDSLRETTTGGAHLRVLILHNATLNDVIMLIGSLTLPVLEELILIDMYDDKLCTSTHLPALKNLHFSLCFPQEIEHAWRMSSFNFNRQWPFDNINYYTDERHVYVWETGGYITKIVLVIYNCPVNLLYHHKRTFYNHGFATNVSAPIRTIRRRLVQWTCGQKYDAEQFNKTLQIVASGHVNELHLTYLDEQMNISTIPNGDLPWNLSLNHLRSITFNIDSNSIKNCERIVMVERILDASPNLSSLVVSWRDFRQCSRKYLNLKHVHLLLNGQYDNPKRYINICQLHELVPHLSLLETSGGVMKQNEDLVEVIVNISHQFEQLVYLVLNKSCCYRSTDKQKLKFNNALIAATHEKIFHGYNIHFRFHLNDELRIWF
ncbi:hypothetical protein I4U23_028196 [Adineta vaga]|nr:hypothetical protein I4U23_028196 [Adineta vaga]